LPGAKTSEWPHGTRNWWAIVVTVMTVLLPGHRRRIRDAGRSCRGKRAGHGDVESKPTRGADRDGVRGGRPALTVTLVGAAGSW